MMDLPTLRRCLLCKACTCVPRDEQLITHQGSPGDPAFITEDHVSWLKKYRIIVSVAEDGWMPYPFAKSGEVFLTGVVRERPAGSRRGKVRVWPAPALPQPAAEDIDAESESDTEVHGFAHRHTGRRWDQVRQDNDSVLEFSRGTALTWQFPGSRHVAGEIEDGDEVLSAPGRLFCATSTHGRVQYDAIHDQCLRILEQVRLFTGQRDMVRGIEQGDVFDIEPEVVDALARRREHVSYDCEERRSWGFLEEDGMDDAVGATPKAYFCDPIHRDHIERIRPYLVISSHQTDDKSNKYNNHLDEWQRALLLAKEPRANDLLSALPAEILMHISSYLPVRAMAFLCYASHAAAWKLNNAGLWYQRLRDDMPWLWDVTIGCMLEEQASLTGVRSTHQIDWQAIYFDLKEQSIFHSRKKTLSLVNRRRIWNICLDSLEKAELE